MPGTSGAPLTEAVEDALRERLAATAARSHEPAHLLATVREVQEVVAALPDRDTPSPDEVLGYDARGLHG